MSTLTQNNPDLIQERNHSLLNDSDLAVRVGCDHRPTTQNPASLTMAEISGFVLTSVLTRSFFGVACGQFTYKKRRGRESNPRIAVLQTATLPLGYPAICASD